MDYNKDKFSEIYQTERNKLTILPDADADFTALENTYRNYDYNEFNNSLCDEW